METFLIKEAYLIAIALDLTESELNEIFLASKSHKRNTLNKRSVIIYE